jgi:hypothetical protein
MVLWYEPLVHKLTEHLYLIVFDEIYQLFNNGRDITAILDRTMHVCKKQEYDISS